MDSLLDEEGDAEEESTLLSFCEKPDRSMALLDDYEMEELDFVNDDPSHRSGYVAVVKPNVGKCTLSDQMIRQKLSIVTDKPQTTRHRILGICSGQDDQKTERRESYLRCMRDFIDYRKVCAWYRFLFLDSCQLPYIIKLDFQ